MQILSPRERDGERSKNYESIYCATIRIIFHRLREKRGMPNVVQHTLCVGGAEHPYTYINTLKKFNFLARCGGGYTHTRQLP